MRIGEGVGAGAGIGVGVGVREKSTKAEENEYVASNHGGDSKYGCSFIVSPVVHEGQRCSAAAVGVGFPLPRMLETRAAEGLDFKLSLAEWSLHRALFSGKIFNLDFPKIAREEYGIEGQSS